jgi:hypothetical protein
MFGHRRQRGTDAERHSGGRGSRAAVGREAGTSRPRAQGGRNPAKFRSWPGASLASRRDAPTAQNVAVTEIATLVPMS